MRNRIAVFFVLLLSLPGIAVAGIAPTGSNSPRTLPTLGQAEHPKQEMAKKPLRRALRQNAQKKAALSWGAQTGYAKKTELRNRWLRTHAEVLDKIFTFRPFLEGDEHVLLPAVDSGRRGFRLEDPLAADSTLVSYRIRETARIVSIPPTFRDYLILDPGTPKKLILYCFPKTPGRKNPGKNGQKGDGKQEKSCPTGPSGSECAGSSGRSREESGFMNCSLPARSTDRPGQLLLRPHCGREKSSRLGTRSSGLPDQRDLHHPNTGNSLM